MSKITVKWTCTHPQWCGTCSPYIEYGEYECDSSALIWIECKSGCKSPQGDFFEKDGILTCNQCNCKTEFEIVKPH